MRSVALTGLLSLLSVPMSASDAESLANERIEALRSELIEVRRDLHRHPEVSGEEERTAGVVARRLEALGIDVLTGVGGHGVVGLLRGAQSGPLVAFRADMDAVPSTAPDPVEFRSVNEGVRHICGHDIHTTIGLALAEGLAAARSELAGSVLFVFQPAEERADGANAMIADGLFDDRKPDAIYALHTAPLEVGQLATAPEVLMAGRDRVTLTVGGGDSDGAAAHLRDLVARMNEVATLTPAQSVAPQTGEFIVLQMGSPSRDQNGTWTVQGMATTSSYAQSTVAEQNLRHLLAAAAAPGLDVDLDYETRAIVGVINDRAVTERAVGSVRRALGQEGVVELTTLVPAFSEDFGSMQLRVPGVLFFLGVSNAEKGIVGMPHSPGYVADEESIFVGAKAMVAVIVDRLLSPAP